MKTKIISILLVLCTLICLFALASCEKKDENGDGGAENSSVIYSTTYKGVKLTPGAPAKAAVETIDEEYAYEEVGSCIGDGKDKRYSYSAIRIETVNNDGVDYISAIYLINDLSSTDEGLTIGSSESDIISKYGEDCTVENGVYTYSGKDKTALRIFTKDGSVSSVCYFWS